MLTDKQRADLWKRGLVEQMLDHINDLESELEYGSPEPKQAMYLEEKIDSLKNKLKLIKTIC